MDAIAAHNVSSTTTTEQGSAIRVMLGSIEIGLTYSELYNYELFKEKALPLIQHFAEQTVDRWEDVAQHLYYSIQKSVQPKPVQFDLTCINFIEHAVIADIKQEPKPIYQNYRPKLHTQLNRNINRTKIIRGRSQRYK